MEELGFTERFTRGFYKGDIVFQEGAPGNEMFVVAEGEVEIFKRFGGAEKTIAILGKGEIFGEMSMLESSPRMAGARANTDHTRLIAIDQSKFIYLVSQQPVFALTVMQALCHRLRSIQ